MDGESVKISVIIPVYNKARYIEKTINSILNQTYTNFELVIIDDGSNDGSEKICDEYSKKDSRIKVIHLKNGGVSNARNIGLSIAKGKYIQFIDSDDYIDKNMFDNLATIMDKYNPDIVMSGITKVNHQNEDIKEILPKLKGMKTRLEMLENFAEEQHTTGIFGCVSNKLIKRSVIIENNIRFNEKIKLAEDLDFYLNLYNYIDNIYFCDKSFYYYIQNAENSSTSEFIVNDYFCQILIILREKELLINNNSLNTKNEYVVNKVISNFVLCYVIDKFNFNYRKFENKLNCIYDNNMILLSLANHDQGLFNKFIIILLSKKISFLVYLLILNRIIIRNLYRKIKNIK